MQTNINNIYNQSLIDCWGYISLWELHRTVINLFHWVNLCMSISDFIKYIKYNIWFGLSMYICLILRDSKCQARCLKGHGLLLSSKIQSWSFACFHSIFHCCLSLVIFRSVCSVAISCFTSICCLLGNCFKSYSMSEKICAAVWSSASASFCCITHPPRAQGPKKYKTTVLTLWQAKQKCHVDWESGNWGARIKGSAPAICNMQYAICIMQHAACSMQHWGYGIPNAYASWHNMYLMLHLSTTAATCENHLQLCWLLLLASASDCCLCLSLCVVPSLFSRLLCAQCCNKRWVALEHAKMRY